MLPAQRRLQMADLINRKGGINTEALAQHFGVSIMTARRDLKILEQENRLKVTWGGAVPMNFQPHDIPYANKTGHMREAKKAITRHALDMIKDDSCILLDAGTTTLKLARLLLDRRLTVITTDLQIALLLSSAPQISVHMACGVIDPVSRACNDISTVNYLRPLSVTQAFIGTNVWDAQRGVTTSSNTKMHIKRQIMDCAEQTVLLADSSKYATYSPWSVAALADFSCIITDSLLAPSIRNDIEQSGATLCMAPFV